MPSRSRRGGFSESLARLLGPQSHQGDPRTRRHGKIMSMEPLLF